MNEETTELVLALETAEAEYLFDCVSALKQMRGNPYKAAAFENGAYKSFLVAEEPSPMNTRLCGVDPDNPVLPKRELNRFAKAGLSANIPVIGKPVDIRKKVEQWGAKPLRGWTHGQFCTDIKSLKPIKTAHKVRKLGAKDMDSFVEVHSNGFRSSRQHLDMALARFSGLVSAKRAEAYGVEIEGSIVAVGLVYFARNKCGYLATSATLKSARKQGAHAALIHRRIAAARLKGCKHVFATALLGSQSRRNLEAAGLSLSHVQTLVTV